MRVAALIGLVAVTSCLGACDGETTDAARQPASVTAVASSRRLTTKIVLPSRTMKSESTMQAELVVNNDSGRPLGAYSCAKPFGLVLKQRGALENAIGWSACGGIFVLPEGASRFPLRVDAHYGGCKAAGVERCVDGHPASFAPGKYQVVLMQDPQEPHFLPTPAPIVIRVTA